MTTSDSAQLNGDVTSHMRNAASSAADHDVTVTSTAAAMKANEAGGGDAVAAAADALRPATSRRTWRRRDAVRLDVEETGPLAEPPVTVITAFRSTVNQFPDQIALASKVDGVWQKMTFKEYYNNVIAAAKSLIKLQLDPFRSVGILGFNSPEWLISNLAAIFAGGLSTGIYATNSAEACRSIAAAAECVVIIVENDNQLQKILKVWDQLPLLRAVVQYKGIPHVHPGRSVYSWAEFMQLGDNVPDSVVEERIRTLAPNQCCSLIFTSGTTGTAKGVMLSHDNLIWIARMCGTATKWRYSCEVLVSYLPLSHVAAQIADIYCPLLFAASVYFAQPDALKGSLVDTMKEVRPTTFFGVPRVWEKIQEKMVAVGRTRGFVSRWIVSWAKYIGLAGSISLMNGGSVPYGWTLANWLVFGAVRQALGFDRCQLFLASAAPMMKETLEFFHSLNIPVMEIYGMSECSGPHTFSLPWQYRLPSAGKALPGTTSRMRNVDSSGCGEVCVYGRHVFMGYLNNESETCEALNDDGWLNTGDVGKFDDDGFLYITGRLKEILITAGGENVAPVPIEDAVKEQLPCISNCMLIGDRRKFLSILLTLKATADRDTQEPQDELTSTAVAWFESVGVDVSTVSDVLSSEDERITQSIQDGIMRANQRAVSRAQNIQKWHILPRDFSVVNGELGPTMKLKRQAVTNMYEKEIDALYADAAGH